eukprot:CAMPEP_0178372238 /NCGR_PEP_ID=MMETSP0689_2-20121128/1248_1 /TAXON_ID=160604 /ORGANISM="Amphidinium massartii, Strain CS-259" /LENGTH=839 /DNA_ID=CAMNT_0019992151 /DNA_START=12 /DNA_END=2528 /DNA_ORIENTATION=+
MAYGSQRPKGKGKGKKRGKAKGRGKSKGGWYGSEDAGEEEEEDYEEAKGKGRGPYRKKSSTERKENRAKLTEEIQELEARIAAEAPPAGTGGNAALVKALTEDPEEQQDKSGPMLTAQRFADLPLSRVTLRGLQAAKFTRMTAIQQSAIPHALAGRDIMGEAKTGSGKTLAFLVPLVEALYRQRWTQMDGLGAVVISPTRELAYQTFKVLQEFGQKHEFSAGCIVGGRSMEEEQAMVSTMCILVATPGRFLQHLDESPGFDAANLRVLVLDEADRILDFGFQETVENILAGLPADRQSMLFSATLHASVHRLGKMALQSPELVSVHRNSKSRTPEKLKQVYMTVPLEKKIDTLFSFLRSHSKQKMIVFVSACKQVRFLYEAFWKLKPGPAVMELHGRQSLTKRMVVFEKFAEKEGAIALFCTDIAARGVDFPAVDWVVQFDCPESVDSYVHRVGRTARFQSTGSSVLFLCPSELAFIQKLKAARVEARSITIKDGKLHALQEKLGAVLSEDVAIKHLAQKAYISYLRSVYLMKDKDVFKVNELPRMEFAASLGLVNAPEVPQLPDNVDVEQNPLKASKNKSALQRLKEKIKAKKAAAKGGKPLQEDAGSDSDYEKDVAKRASAKKVGKWERRQRQIEAAKAKSKDESAAQLAAGEDDDELLEAVGDVRDVAESRPTALLQSSKRLKIGKDGVAKGAWGTHKYFGEEGEDGTELSQLASEMKASNKSSTKRTAQVTVEGRESFLQRVTQELQRRDPTDAEASRNRIQEKHQSRKRKLRKARGGDQGSESEETVGFCDGSDGDDDNISQEDDGEVAAPSAQENSSPREVQPKLPPRAVKAV